MNTCQHVDLDTWVCWCPSIQCQRHTWGSEVKFVGASMPFGHISNYQLDAYCYFCSRLETKIKKMHQNKYAYQSYLEKNMTYLFALSWQRFIIPPPLSVSGCVLYSWVATAVFQSWPTTWSWRHLSWSGANWCSRKPWRITRRRSWRWRNLARKLRWAVNVSWYYIIFIIIYYCYYYYYYFNMYYHYQSAC